MISELLYLWNLHVQSAHPECYAASSSLVGPRRYYRCGSQRTRLRRASSTWIGCCCDAWSTSRTICGSPSHTALAVWRPGRRSDLSLAPVRRSLELRSGLPPDGEMSRTRKRRGVWIRTAEVRRATADSRAVRRRRRAAHTSTRTSSSARSFWASSWRSLLWHWTPARPVRRSETGSARAPRSGFERRRARDPLRRRAEWAARALAPAAALSTSQRKSYMIADWAVPRATRAAALTRAVWLATGAVRSAEAERARRQAASWRRAPLASPAAQSPSLESRRFGRRRRQREALPPQSPATSRPPASGRGSARAERRGSWRPCGSRARSGAAAAGSAPARAHTRAAAAGAANSRAAPRPTRTSLRQRPPSGTRPAGERWVAVRAARAETASGAPPCRARAPWRSGRPARASQVLPVHNTKYYVHIKRSVHLRYLIICSVAIRVVYCVLVRYEYDWLLKEFNQSSPYSEFPLASEWAGFPEEALGVRVVRERLECCGEEPFRNRTDGASLFPICDGYCNKQNNTSIINKTIAHWGMAPQPENSTRGRVSRLLPNSVPCGTCLERKI